MEWIDRAREGGWRFCSGVDLSGAGRAGNVIFTGAVDAAGARVPVEIRCGNWTSPELARQLDAVDALFAPEIILVESNGYQAAFRDWAGADRRAHAWVGRVKAFTTGKNKIDVKHGLPGLEVEFENGVWRIPEREFAHHGAACDRGSDGGPCGWCRWTDEMTQYPHVGNDDTVMACWFFREACRRLSFGKKLIRGIQRESKRDSRQF